MSVQVLHSNNFSDKPGAMQNTLVDIRKGFPGRKKNQLVQIKNIQPISDLETYYQMFYSYEMLTLPLSFLP